MLHDGDWKLDACVNVMIFTKECAYCEVEIRKSKGVWSDQMKGYLCDYCDEKLKGNNGFYESRENGC